MNKDYINENILVKEIATFYNKSITCNCNNILQNAEIIKVKNNLFEVNNEFISLVLDVYIKCGLTTDSDVLLSDFDFIYKRFCRKFNLISYLLLQIGYEENYRFMEENGMEVFVKYNFFHKEQRLLYVADPFRQESFYNNKIEDYYVYPIRQTHDTYRYTAFKKREWIYFRKYMLQDSKT